MALKFVNKSKVRHYRVVSWTFLYCSPKLLPSIDAFLTFYDKMEDDFYLNVKLLTKQTHNLRKTDVSINCNISY